MGRIHDALKKAEEERKKKRAEKKKGESPSSGNSVSTPEPSVSQATTSTQAIMPTKTRKSPRTEEVSQKPSPPAETKPRKAKKGIAAGLKLAENSTSSPAASKFGELLLTYHAPSDQRSEQIRALRTNIVNLEPTPVVMAFVSAVGDEGASLTAANLAVSFAEDKSQKVLLVDANIRGSEMLDFFDVTHDAPGFTEILEDKLDPDQAVLDSGVPSLYYVTAGRTVANPGALLSANGVKRILQAWRKRFDRVLMVLPPVTDANDAAVVGREVDGTVLVIKLGSTPRRETEHALEALAHSGVHVLGCVVTNSGSVKEPNRPKS
ncbi:MAG: capsular exopolysaccharide synthesis family protein [Planctomycetota bacterium]|jgi:capsular exopolysaccharide synthesis family protein